MKNDYHNARKIFKKKGGKFVLVNFFGEPLMDVKLGNLVLKSLSLNDMLQQRMDDVIQTALILIDAMTPEEVERIKNS